MEKETVETHKEKLPESAAESGAVAVETTALVANNPAAEKANSHSSVSEPESDSSTAAGIVAEVRELYRGSKVDILIRLIQSRTVEVKYQRQLEVYQVALYEGVKEKTRLQLDLAYCDKMLAVLQREAREGKSTLTTILQQHADAVAMIEKLDAKRTQFIKEEQQIKNELAEYKHKFLQMQQDMQDRFDRYESDSRRYGQLQVQVDKLTKANEVWQKKVCEMEAKQRSMVSAHSAQLSEMENLMGDLEGKLKDTQGRFENEKRTNTLLKEHTDSVLQEKTQLSMDLASVENRYASMEADFERKIAALETKLATVEQDSSGMKEKMAEMTRSAQECNAEKELLVAKLAQEKDVTAEMEGKLGGLQVILNERNNEIFSLHSKLNCELKRVEEFKQQLSQGTSETDQRLSDMQKDFIVKEAKITRLEQDLRNQANAISALKTQLESKDAEIKQLKDKIPNVDHYVAKITQLKDELAVKSSRVAQLEQQAERRASTETRIRGTENVPAQVTSTPICVLESDDETTSNAPKGAKKVRIADPERSSVSPTYSNFQGNVQRRTFFKRAATASTSQISITSASYSQFINNMDLNLSTASTVNVDDEPMDVGNMSSVSTATSAVRHVKPFFRRAQEKK